MQQRVQMPRAKVTQLTKDFAGVLSDFARGHHVSIRDNKVSAESGAVTFQIVMAPTTPAANVAENWVGRTPKLDQTEQVVSLFVDMTEPEAQILSQLYEEGRLLIGTSPFLKTKGWAGRIVGRALKTRMVEFDAMFHDGESVTNPPRRRNHADPHKLLVPADSGVNIKVSAGDKVWVVHSDGLLYRARIASIKGGRATADWLDYPEEPAELVTRSQVYVPMK